MAKNPNFSGGRNREKKKLWEKPGWGPVFLWPKKPKYGVVMIPGCIPSQIVDWYTGNTSCIWVLCR